MSEANARALDHELQRSRPCRRGQNFDEGNKKIMNPTAKPVKKNKKAQPTKKLERKNQLMSVRSLMVKW
jgi:hypothetical protein